jgi:hypothetical protein
VEGAIEAAIAQTSAEQSTEEIMDYVARELGQVFATRTWGEWFNSKIDEAYDRRVSSKDNVRGTGINKSGKSGMRTGGRNRRSQEEFDDDLSTSDSDNEDAPVRSRSNRSSAAGSRQGSPKSTASRSSSKRELVDDDDDDSHEGPLASVPFSQLKIGVFCTVLASADASAVSREVKKARKINTQIWGPMQEQFGGKTGRVVARNESEELVKLQFPKADLWFVYEALDICNDDRTVKQAEADLKRSSVPTPPSGASAWRRF